MTVLGIAALLWLMVHCSPCEAVEMSKTPSSSVPFGPRTCFIHAGTHKTASSYLQSCFRVNRERLEQHGISYSLPGKPGDKFKSLSRDLKKGKLAEWDAYLRNHSESPNSLLISGEQFTAPLCDQETLSGLVSTIQRHDYRTVVIIYVRPQLDYINSLYVHSLRRQYHSYDLESFYKLYPKSYSFGRKSGNANDQDRFNFNRLFQSLLNHPTVSTVFIPFSRSLGTPFSQFLSVLGLPDDEGWLPGDDKRFGNIQPGVKGVWLARQLALRLQNLGVDGNALRNTGEGLRALCEKRGWDKERYFGFSESLANSVLTTYAKDNDEFAQRVWGKNWDSVFLNYSIPAQSVYEPASDEERDEMMGLVDSLLQAIAKDNPPLAEVLASAGS